MDFFTAPTVTFRVLYCFFAISHSRQRILHREDPKRKFRIEGRSDYENSGAYNYRRIGLVCWCGGVSETGGPPGGQPVVTLNTPAAGATHLSDRAYNVATTKIKVVISVLTN
jgi:hypothetical protein